MSGSRSSRLNNDNPIPLLCFCLKYVLTQKLKCQFTSYYITGHSSQCFEVSTVYGEKIFFHSKRKKKAIEKERRKHLRLNRLQPSADDFEQGKKPVSTADAVQKPVAAHETRRKETRKKHEDETGDHTRKTKKTTKNGKHKRLKEEAMPEPAILGGQLEIGERERVPTPIPGHHSINKHTRKKKQKKAHRERREHDEGYSEGSGTKQTGELNTEKLLIRSLPRPRQLAPLPERTDIQL